MKGFLNKLREGFKAVREDDDERGDLVQTILIIAVVAAMVIFVFAKVLWPAIRGQADNTAEKISTSTDFVG